MSFTSNINPVLAHLGPLTIRWYGVIYALGFIIAYCWLRREIKRKTLALSADDTDTFFLYLIPGVVIGARVFEIIFYEPTYYFANPVQMVAVWNGGLSFHGGLVGAALAVYLFTKHKKIPFYDLADTLVIPAAFALFLGRIANFINAELPGIATNVPWCVYFPGVEGCRHPSQLYEAAKNLVICAVLLLVQRSELKKDHHRRKNKGYLFWLFVLLYGTLRFIVNFWRDDPIVFFGLQTGQLLSVAMALAAAIVLWTKYRK